jgi:hypothetical protein
MLVPSSHIFSSLSTVLRVFSAEDPAPVLFEFNECRYLEVYAKYQFI